MKHTVAKLFLLLLLAGSLGFSSCTKTSGCEYVDEEHFLTLTGTFHYFERPVKIQYYPSLNKKLLDVNAYLVRDDFSGNYSDTLLITKSSVPFKYRIEKKKHAAVSLEPIVTTGPTYGRVFYKLLCIEGIE